MESRLKYIDVARGFAILLVVFGHALIRDFAKALVFADYLRFYIYTINMPIFFVISGILFEKNVKKYCGFSCHKFVKDKFLRFMIPYFSFSVLNYFIVFLFSNISFFSAILKKEGFVIVGFFESLFSILTYINHIDNHLWFLYVMFIILILNRMFFCNLSSKRELLIVLVFCLFFYYVGSFLSPYIPEVLFKVMHYNFIFVIGRLSYNLIDFFKDQKNFILTCITCLIFSIIFLLIKDDKSFWFYSSIKLIVELSSSLLTIYYFGKLFAGNKILNYFGSAEKSMVVYLLHMPFILPVIIFVLMKLNISIFIIVLISTVLSLFICLMLYSFVLSKSKIIKKYFFGFNS